MDSSMFDMVPFADLIGLELVEPGDGQAEVTLPLEEYHSSIPDQVFAHGGVVSTLVDAAAGTAAVSLTRSMAPTNDLRVDYLASLASDLTAEAEVVNLASNVALTYVTVSADDTLVAVGRVLFKISGSSDDSPWEGTPPVLRDEFET
jgi:uncharacterized protein (TIGR00369 family)